MSKSFSRRRLLQFGAAAAAAGTLAPLAGGAAAARADGDLPDSLRFDLDTPSTMLLREKALQNVTVLQSLAFDNTNRRIYTAQVVQGGLKLSGESTTVAGADRARRGDLAITQLDLAGNKLGYMYLKGFGHGVSIGVEPVGTSAYLWVETDGVSDGTNAWGRALARLKFTSGQVLTNTSSALEKFQPVAGATSTTPAIDPTTNRLIMRYVLNGQRLITAYDLASVKARTYAPLATVQQPAVVAPTNQPFQGYTALGRYLYLLEGAAYGNPGSTAPDGNTYITSVDLTTGAVVQRFLTRAGYSLDYREPEGMAIQLTNPADPSSARLTEGFASGASGARKMSVYYKDVLV
ncbi:hypothetical protein AB0J86_15105 [Micromonospora sp. NPDC049559]|uniref:phage baseplate protein n=1 Tax=Micromonospora sp. NPDC049559 TaxID=3155923 RepID=UPI003421565F